MVVFCMGITAISRTQITVITRASLRVLHTLAPHHLPHILQGDNQAPTDPRMDRIALWARPNSTMQALRHSLKIKRTHQRRISRRPPPALQSFTDIAKSALSKSPADAVPRSNPSTPAYVQSGSTYNGPTPVSGFNNFGQQQQHPPSHASQYNYPPPPGQSNQAPGSSAPSIPQTSSFGGATNAGTPNYPPHLPDSLHHTIISSLLISPAKPTSHHLQANITLKKRLSPRAFLVRQEFKGRNSK